METSKRRTPLVRAAALVIAAAAAAAIAVLLPSGAQAMSLGWDSEQPKVGPDAAEQLGSEAPVADLAAAQTCPSSPQGTPHDILAGRITVRVLYTSANGGTNCVWAVKNVGVGTPESGGFELVLGVCYNGKDPSGCKDVDADGGRFSYYAGPVVAKGTAGNCIFVTVYFRGSHQYLGPFHCGG